MTTTTRWHIALTCLTTLGLAACGGDAASTGSGTGGAGSDAFQSGGGSGATASGGAFNPTPGGGTGNVGVPTGEGGVPVGGGGVPVGGGGVPVGGGGVLIGGGGVSPAGGTGSGGVPPVDGPVQLVHCDQQGESSAAPVTDPCSDITTPTGVNLQLGPYGAQMDVNVGQGFENVDPADMATCPTFVNLFNEDANLSAQLLDVGPQPCNATAPNTGDCLDFKLYSVYRPANWPEGPVPVLTWGNGTCAQPEGYGALLRYVASYGFFVVAANSREVGDGSEQTHAIDFAAAANDDPSSPYYGHLDLSKVGAMGHSQGSQGTAAAANDPRVLSAILFNAGNTASKPYLAISGDLDITGYSAASMASAIAGQPKAAYLYYYNPTGNPLDNLRGHLVLMLSPERVTEQTVAWWQMTLQGDSAAHDKFVGPSCAFCGHTGDYDFGQSGL